MNIASSSIAIISSIEHLHIDSVGKPSQPSLSTCLVVQSPSHHTLGPGRGHQYPVKTEQRLSCHSAQPVTRSSTVHRKVSPHFGNSAESDNPLLQIIVLEILRPR